MKPILCLLTALAIVFATSSAFTSATTKINAGWFYYDKSRSQPAPRGQAYYYPIFLDPVNNGETADPEGICLGMDYLCAIHFDEQGMMTDYLYYSVE